MQQPSILIVKLSAIGDVVHTLPALNAVRRHYPRAHIAWLVEEAAAGLLQGHTALDDVLVSRRRTWIKGLRSSQRGRHLKELLAFMARLRSRRYDLVLDFQASIKGAVLIAWVRAGRKVGFGRGLEHQEHSYLVLNERLPAVSMEIHALERGLLLLQAIGIPTPAVEYHLPIAAAHQAKADDVLACHGIAAGDLFVALNPMAQWPTKLWDQRKFAQLADRIQKEFGLPAVFTGGPEDRSYIQAILGRMQTRAPSLAGRTDLLTLAALLQRAALMVTTDTGPMHMAAAVGTPTVALFGPTAPWRTGPYGAVHRIVRAAPDCSPCFKRKCRRAVECMAAIEVEQVMAPVAELLQNSTSEGGVAPDSLWGSGH